MFKNIKNKLKELNMYEEDIERLKKREEALNLISDYCKKGILPRINPDGIMLSKNEVCHFQCKAIRLVDKQERVYHRGSSGIGFRVAKGVYVGSGRSRRTSTSKTVQMKYVGNFYVTSSKIIFINEEKPCTIPLKQIISVKTYKDGIALFKGQTKYLFKTGEVESELISKIIKLAHSKINC